MHPLDGGSRRFDPLKFVDSVITSREICMRAATPLAMTLFLVCIFSEAVQAGKETPFQLECSDTFLLDGVMAEPGDDDAGGKRKVVILLHGSGPQSMDEDLTVVTRDGKPNLFYMEGGIVVEVVWDTSFHNWMIRACTFGTAHWYEDTRVFIRT